MYKILPDEPDYSHEFQVFYSVYFLMFININIYLGFAPKVYTFITKDIYYVHLLLSNNFFIFNN